jgi:hypothetical protein
MANLSTTLVTQELISYSVVTDKSGLVKLLERNGVQMPNNPSDKEVTVAVLMASAKSQNFKDELAAFLTNKVKEAGNEFQSFVGGTSDFGFTGIDDFSFTGVDDLGFTGADKFYNLTAAEKKAARVSATNPQGKTKTGLALAGIGKFLKDSVLTPENVNAGIQIGLNKINNQTQADSNKIQNQALVLQQQQDDLKKNLPQGQGMSPAVKYTLIGVGALAIVGIVYVIVKKK